MRTVQEKYVFDLEILDPRPCSDLIGMSHLGVQLLFCAFKRERRST